MSNIVQDRILWPHVEPYDVQRLAVDAAEQALAQQQSALVVCPTGLGKTVMVAELARRYVEERDERVLVIAHTEELIDQAREKIVRYGFGGDEHKVGVEMAERAVDIGGMFAPSVVVASVQSMCRDERLARFPANTFGLVVIDEAHHATAATYRKVIDWFLESAHLLGVTATPDRRDRKALGDIFATVAYEYETRQAISDGHLVPFVASSGLLPRIDLSKVREVAGDLNQGELDEAVIVIIDEAAMAIAGKIGNRRGIAFLPTVDSATLMADALRAIGISAESLSGRSSDQERNDVVSRFRDGDGIQVLCNCALFTEGFDVPEVSMIAVLRPTTSRALYSQMLGRGLRLAPWAEKVDCMILDFPGVGWNGRKGHRLANPFDALGGITDEDIARKAAELVAAGENTDFMEAMDQAASEVESEREEKREAARLVKAKRAAEETRLDLLAKDHCGEPWVAELRDTWGLWDGSQPRKPSEMPSTPERAAVLLAKLRERKRTGLCTWPQARVLRRNRLPTTCVPKAVASQWIDQIAACGWKSVPARVRAEAEQFWVGDVTRRTVTA